MKIVGYADRYSVVAGERISFMVSCEEPTFDLDFVRLRHGDDNPDGPGVKILPVDVPGATQLGGQRHGFPHGSLVRTPSPVPHLRDGSLSVGCWIWPTLLTRPRQVLTSLDGLSLALEVDGRVVLRIGTTEIRTTRPVLQRHWTFVCATCDAASGHAGLHVIPLKSFPGAASPETLVARVDQVSSLTSRPFSNDAALLIGAETSSSDARWPYSSFYNGRIAETWVANRALSTNEIEALRRGGDLAALPGIVAAWQFGDCRDLGVARDGGPHALHGTVFNMPQRGVPGPHWNNSSDDWRVTPGQFGSIHFHEDDMSDAGWPVAHTLEVPPELPSGIYGARLRARSAEDIVPFFVRPARGMAQASVLFLAPTLSYLAYANWQAFAHPEIEPGMRASVGDAEFERIRSSPESCYVVDQRLLSLYDTHADGSGVVHAGLRRPLLSMRATYRWPLAPAGTQHQLGADLHLIDWLEGQGIVYDVATDHDLDAEGVALLEHYRVVLTGSHPEYHTRATLDGLQQYVDGGGRLMYLGGNGFYWVTTLDRARDVIEVRRCNGTRNYILPPGESRHAMTGETGGIWRDRGRAPQKLCGIGFSAYGTAAGSPYRRLESSFEPDVAWIFDGISADELIGDTPNLARSRGAAGLECDRYDPGHGTPPGARRLATADQLDPGYFFVVEDMGAAMPMVQGGVHPLVRADMVYFETAGSGAVWSTGSISWCGALSYNEYRNAVSRVTLNVLNRFRH